MISGSSPGSAKFALRAKIAVRAKHSPAPMPRSAAGWSVARPNRRQPMSRPASERNITPATLTPTPSQDRGASTSPSTTAAMSEAWTASVLE